jgi:outer membrane protein assembly factor BamE (lipoprotein component of BamABCDE complex)
MANAINSPKILKKIGCPMLDLVNGKGYWYFVYDDVENNIWETESVYTMYLNSLSVEQWVNIGKDL